MAQESCHLLSCDNDDVVADSNATSSFSVSNNDDDRLTSALKLITEQSEQIAELRHRFLAEQGANASLSKKVDLLCSQVEKLNSKYTTEISERNKEIDKLKKTIEAHNESQAAIADEFRFQIQSLRNKFDPNKNHDVTENGNMLLINKKQSNKNKSPAHQSHNILKRQNSADSSCSTNSNPCFSSQLTVTHQGEITWRINAFSKKLKRICSGHYDDPIRSEAFTTGPFGYRLSGWAYLNGRGKGQDHYLSVYIRVMAGEYDPILQWPIKPCYTFYLISQDVDVNKRFDLVRTRDLSVKHSGIFRPQKDDKTIIVGFDDFIVHEDIEKKNYLLDDSLFLRLVVEIPPPI